MQLAYAIGTILFALVAAYFLASGFMMATDMPSLDGSGSVANLQLMHIQSINFATGIGAAIISAILSLGLRD